MSLGSIPIDPPFLAASQGPKGPQGPQGPQDFQDPKGPMPGLPEWWSTTAVSRWSQILGGESGEW